MEAALYFFKVFTDDAESGNPAACALLTQWPDCALLQQMAFQSGQVVTAFLLATAEDPAQYQIRWFSRTEEINLCGHGTLAAAALLRQLKGEGRYRFVSPYGVLHVSATADHLLMQLPQWQSAPAELASSLQAYQILDCFQTRDLVLVLADQQAVQQFKPDFELIRQLPQHALIITAFSPPDTYVLRYFAPAIGINEDIATGSAQCSLAPYWAVKTGLTEFQVLQLSAIPASFAVTILSGQLHLKTQAVPFPCLIRSVATMS